MTDEQKRIEDAPEVEGQAKRFHEPAADVEGHASPKVADESDAEAEATAEQTGGTDEPEVEGHAKRFH